MQFDTQTKDMVNSPELLSLTSNIVVVDHHRATEEIIPSIFSYVESSASSTVELLVEVMGFLEKVKSTLLLLKQALCMQVF
ncbi:DHH family phosphoesterase [Areca yellow leaf disease phytoplasma]|uniref:DHH family phosphoesterase n=1 Tax=Areca yellow leaf disease phytoplasma TaxID=927614 RepID=UPI0035B5325B